MGYRIIRRPTDLLLPEIARARTTTVLSPRKMSSKHNYVPMSTLRETMTPPELFTGGMVIYLIVLYVGREVWERMSNEKSS